MLAFCASGQCPCMLQLKFCQVVIKLCIVLLLNSLVTCKDVVLYAVRPRFVISTILSGFQQLFPIIFCMLVSV